MTTISLWLILYKSVIDSLLLFAIIKMCFIYFLCKYLIASFYISKKLYLCQNNLIFMPCRIEQRNRPTFVNNGFICFWCNAMLIHRHRHRHRHRLRHRIIYLVYANIRCFFFFAIPSSNLMDGISRQMVWFSSQ